MLVEEFVSAINSDFYTGVPDSQLRALCDYLINTYGTDPKHHIIAANEGNCVGIAAGYNMATGKVPVVYMQNSGEGNIINPVASLLNDRVYAIPVLFVIGWRGEPGVHDEPQHIYQGEITLKLLDDLDIAYHIVDKEQSSDDIQSVMNSFNERFDSGLCSAFVIRKGALEYSDKIKYSNDYEINRETAIEHIVNAVGDGKIVCTTGKASRELFEIRERNGQGHENDFLTVGSMGHASSIALGLAINQPDKKIWCIDGDGAMLMHMGALAVIGDTAPANLVHILINNSAHETVGGMPTVMDRMNIHGIATGCMYPKVLTACNYTGLDDALAEAKAYDGLCMIEVKCGLGARDDLGRPTVSPSKNKEAFMNSL